VAALSQINQHRRVVGALGEFNFYVTQRTNEPTTEEMK
jgi:hypothetical protein